MNHQSRVFSILSAFCVLFFIQNANATEFKVGGSMGWTVPSQSYNQWAEWNRFQIGDTLVFDYPADKDSVLRVTKDDYNNCNTGSPIVSFSSGHTVFKFNQSGPYYFVSGKKDNCLKNEKLVVVVLADRNKNSGQTSSPPPSASTGTVPSPAPASEAPPSPPPSVTSDGVPSSSPPTSETPTKNGASSVASTLAGSLGAFICSSLLLLTF